MLYLITGDDTYEKEKRLNEIEESFGEKVKGINYVILDKDSLSSLENEINTYAFGFSCKLIVVKIEKKSEKSTTSDDSSSAEEKNDWLSESMENVLSSLGQDVTVVFYGDFQKRSRVFKLVQKYGTCVTCERQKEYELLSWCSQYLKENGISIDTADINYFISLCGAEKWMLKNEMDKLISYALDTKIITKKDIDKLSIRTSDVIIFDLTDNLGNKNICKAISALNELIENKEPIQKIVIMIAKHFKALLVAKVATMKNTNVMDELATKSTYASNKYKMQSKCFQIRELVNIISELSKLDIDSKLGKIDLRIGLERIILRGALS